MVYRLPSVVCHTGIYRADLHSLQHRPSVYTVLYHLLHLSCYCVFLTATIMESHLQYLCIKYRGSLKVSKMVGHGQRPDSNALTLHTLILSKMDCGSFIYDSSMKSKLSILNPAHSIGIHLATGAFHASPLESLYV